MADLGKRYKCYKCATKFYDLSNPQPICPICGEDQNNEETKKLLRRKRKRVLSKVKADIPPVSEESPVDEDSDDEVEEYVLDMEDIVIEDCPWLLSTYRVVYALYYDWLENYYPHDFIYGTARFQEINVEMRERMLR